MGLGPFPAGGRGSVGAGTGRGRSGARHCLGVPPAVPRGETGAHVSGSNCSDVWQMGRPSEQGLRERPGAQAGDSGRPRTDTVALGFTPAGRESERCEHPPRTSNPLFPDAAKFSRESIRKSEEPYTTPHGTRADSASGGGMAGAPEREREPSSAGRGVGAGGRVESGPAPLMATGNIRRAFTQGQLSDEDGARGPRLLALARPPAPVPALPTPGASSMWRQEFLGHERLSFAVLVSPFRSCRLCQMPSWPRRPSRCWTRRWPSRTSASSW